MAVSYPLYDEPVSFTWLDIRNPDYEQGVITEGLAENEVYKAASELTGINVEWDLRMDGATTYALMIAGGDYPDCWGSKLSDYYSSYDTALEEDVIIDLTDLISEYMPSYTAALAGDKNLESTSYTEDGKRLAVYPINTGYTQFGGQIRGDIVDKLGLELPETFDDMYDMLKAMKSEYPDSQPLILSKDGSQNCSWLGGGLWHHDHGVLAALCADEPVPCGRRCKAGAFGAGVQGISGDDLQVVFRGPDLSGLLHQRGHGPAPGRHRL